MANMINTILITSEDEENIIDLEPDASTMTSNSVAGSETKKLKNTRQSNILDLISGQSSGIKPSSVFKSNMMALKTNSLELTNIFPTVHPELHISDCDYIRSGQDGHSVLGVWHGDQYDAIFYKLGLNVSPRASTDEDDTPSFLNSIEYIGPFFSKSEITDICDTNCRDQNYVLYVGNCYNEGLMPQSSAVFCSFINSSSSIGKQYVSQKELLSCCGSQNGDVFATGSEEGVYLYHDQEFIYHNQELGRVSAIEFNSSGNILYCGEDRSNIAIFDRRESPWSNSAFQIMNCTSGISEIKLFSNGNNVVVSSFNGSLSQIDLRKRDTVFSYPDHVGINDKSPFSLIEDTDILCATGADKLTRLWSLRSGSLLCTIEPQIKTTKVHSCLIVDECRWLVALFQKNKMYIMEPKN